MSGHYEVMTGLASVQGYHIDGAVLWHIYADLKDADYRLAGTTALARLVALSGIGPDSTVVFYGYAPALGLWLLKLYGHPYVRILDCSRDTWRAGGFPWSTAPSDPAAGGFCLRREDSGIRADQAAVRKAIGQPGTTLVDVRSAAEYRGERFWPSGAMEPGGRAGYVPSAIHQPIDGLYHETGPSAPRRSCDRPGGQRGADHLLHHWRACGYGLARAHPADRPRPGPGLRRILGRVGPHP
jgi:thiosulfate/3-mercaptopyruvate sulfurtransferase